MDKSIDKTVLITGAGSGIGLGIAEAFLKEGYRVHICDVSHKAIDDAQAANPGLRGFISDVGDHQAVAALIGEVRSWAGEVDVLINNAGIAGPTALAEDVSPEAWAQTININLNGMFYCTREVIPAMKKMQAGSIINISSCSARVAMTRRLPYVASKVGVLGFSHALARELGPHNIRVNTILPGAVNSARCQGMLKSFAEENNLSSEQAEAEFLRFVSMKTWIQPSEVADLAVFLTSDKGRHITGQEIGVDGLIEWEE